MMQNGCPLSVCFGYLMTTSKLYLGVKSDLSDFWWCE